jgi:hypothetical protein
MTSVVGQVSVRRCLQYVIMCLDIKTGEHPKKHKAWLAETPYRLRHDNAMPLSKSALYLEWEACFFL